MLTKSSVMSHRCFSASTYASVSLSVVASLRAQDSRSWIPFSSSVHRSSVELSADIRSDSGIEPLG